VHDVSRPRAAGAGLIRRRHVFYVEGYDPQGAEGYYKLFERSWKRFLTIWPLTSKLGPLEIESQEFAHWNIEAAAPNWQVATRYEFLRQEHIIRANMAEPMTRQIPRALGWALDYLVSGALLRVFRASWEFGVVLMSFQAMITWWLLLSAAGGWLIGELAARYVGLPGIAAVVIGIAGAFAIFGLLRLLANRWFAIQINSHWPYLCEFARGEPSCFDRPIDACVERLIAAARANAVDEIVVVGHSGGGALAPVVLARALERDPELGRRGPPIVLLTLGSIMPGAALHPKAVQLRSVVARLAVEPSIAWIDCQSRKDVMNFWDFDPVAGIGVAAGEARCNPLVWKLRFREMLSPEFYKRLRLNFFRMHYQFIMANDRRAPYDYFMLMCGPLAVATWARSYGAVMAAFAEDARLAEDRVTAPA
jgi:pimeloyl-ACP methyl ester carboxylesterase